jgi:hypothetical protein
MMRPLGPRPPITPRRMHASGDPLPQNRVHVLHICLTADSLRSTRMPAQPAHL